jgi:thiol-disulfide isomerase/thioredoxin
MHWFKTLFLSFALSFLLSSFSAAQEETLLTVSSGEEISAIQYPADGEYLMLWFAPEYGLRKAHALLAQQLSEQQGIEVWLVDLAESLFLPQGPASIRALDNRIAAELIEIAHQRSQKKVVVSSDGYGAITALSAVHQWQKRKPETAYLAGAILFSPHVYTGVPALGVLPEFMPVAAATNIPIMIYQARGSGTTVHFERLKEQLQSHENPVYSQLLPELSSLFYDHEPSEVMQRQLTRTGANMKKIIRMLERHELPLIANELKPQTQRINGIDIALKPFKGNNKPYAIQLQDAQGELFQKNHYAGQVTLVNFWASWCPPCVEEIPSLNRLQKELANESFELISINYAEDKATINEFLKKVKVEFPVLLDIDGQYSKNWKVTTYPSTFVINKDGEIQYGVNAAIEWDAPEVIKKLRSMAQ